MIRRIFDNAQVGSTEESMTVVVQGLKKKHLFLFY